MSGLVSVLVGSIFSLLGRSRGLVLTGCALAASVSRQYTGCIVSSEYTVLHQYAG